MEETISNTPSLRTNSEIAQLLYHLSQHLIGRSIVKQRPSVVTAASRLPFTWVRHVPGLGSLELDPLRSRTCVCLRRGLLVEFLHLCFHDAAFPPVLFTCLLSALQAITLSYIHLHNVNIIQSQDCRATFCAICKSIRCSGDPGGSIETSSTEQRNTGLT